MPVAQQEQQDRPERDRHVASDYPDGGADDAIARLESALSRIAGAAGRRQDALRVAELTARSAQHEADLMARAQRQHEAEAHGRAESEAGWREQAADAAAAQAEQHRLEVEALVERHRADLQASAEQHAGEAEAQAVRHRDGSRQLADRLDGLIAQVRAALAPGTPSGPAGEG